MDLAANGSCYVCCEVNGMTVLWEWMHATATRSGVAIGSTLDTTQRRGTTIIHPWTDKNHCHTTILTPKITIAVLLLASEWWAGEECIYRERWHDIPALTRETVTNTTEWRCGLPRWIWNHLLVDNSMSLLFLYSINEERTTTIVSLLPWFVQCLIASRLVVSFSLLRYCVRAAAGKGPSMMIGSTRRCHDAEEGLCTKAFLQVAASRNLINYPRRIPQSSLRACLITTTGLKFNC